MRFRSDFHQALTAAVAQSQTSGQGEERRYEPLSLPHRNSPFLTLAEWPDGSTDGLPSRVVKVLAVPDEDAAFASWSDILEREKDRWRDELEQRLERPGTIGPLALPLTVSPAEVRQVARISQIGPIPRSQLLEEASPSPQAGLRFPCLVRPYIPWPRLQDIGYSLEQMRQRWWAYCDTQRNPEQLRRHQELFRHFREEALVNGDRDVLLTTAWRLDLV